MRTLIILIMIFMASSSYADLASEAGQIAYDIAQLTIKSQKLFDKYSEFSLPPKVKKRKRMLRSAYGILKNEKMAVQFHGPNRSVAPYFGSISSVATQDQTLGFHEETAELLEIASEFDQQIEKIKELHQNYTLTYLLWFFLNNYFYHPGYALKETAITNQVTSENPPTEELGMFIDLLQKTLHYLLAYSTFQSEIISEALQIKNDISGDSCIS